MEKTKIEIVDEWFHEHFAHRVSMTGGTPENDYYKGALVKLEARLTETSEEAAQPQPEKQEP